MDEEKSGEQTFYCLSEFTCFAHPLVIYSRMKACKKDSEAEYVIGREIGDEVYSCTSLHFNPEEAEAARISDLLIRTPEI